MRKNRIIIDEGEDVFYIGYPTNSYTVGVEFDDDIVFHYDVKEKTVIGVTILHWQRFKKRLERRIKR